MTDRLYLDYNATAKIRPEVIDALGSAMAHVGNASSVHNAGREARKSVENARRSVARLVGANADQVVFTSGGTEADNQVMQMCDPARTFVCAIEHPAIRDACPGANDVPVTADGVIDLNALETMLADADAPQLVVVYKQGDFVYRIPKGMLFYITLGTLVVPHFLIAVIANFMKQLKFGDRSVNWFGSFSIVVNVFFAISLIFIDILNSLENFDFNYFGYLTILGLLILVGWVIGMLYFLLKKS